MKTLSSVASKSVDIELVSDYHEFEFILHEGDVVSLNGLTKAQDIKCPRCLGSEGYKIFESRVKSHVWACADRECNILNAAASKSNQNSVALVKRTEMKSVGVPEIYWNSTFSDSLQDEKIVTSLKAFASRPSGFIVMAGTVGTGKTYSACAAIRQYLYGKHSAYFYNISDCLYRQWLDIKTTSLSDLNLLNRLCDIELLVLDDLGQFTPKEGFLDFLYALINRRKQNPNIGTILTTNMNALEMEEKFGSALTSRLTSSIIMKFAGKDKRQALMRSF